MQTTLEYNPVRHKLREQDVYNAWNTIDMSKATGSTRALKIAAPHISQVVTHFYQRVFQSRNVSHLLENRESDSRV